MRDRRHIVIRNIDKVHLTPFSTERIKHNIPDLDITPEELVRNIILDPETTFVRIGKNWNIGNKMYTMSINVTTYVVITARIRESVRLRMAAEKLEQEKKLNEVKDA